MLQKRALEWIDLLIWNVWVFFILVYKQQMKDSLHVLGYIWQIAAHDDDVNAVAFADDSSHILFSGGDDGLCRVRTEWDQKSGQLSKTLFGIIQ